jgi:diaminohydroxyphosphoribosylaminopyrimidine deaminase/5-amino-6-(5-phosphoribosylamino)uracil reductase
MYRCLQIAKNGLGTARPNPMVGALIVCNSKIIGEGFTSPYGGSHAEVNAIKSVTEKNLLNKSTLYVTLEPCSHYGKTPPCSDLIIEHNIPKVVIGCIDDNPEVSGKGIAKLKASGCEVTVGVLERECKLHHKRFFTFHNKKRPYIILKWAETNDGFIAPDSKNQNCPVWISNGYSRQLVHKWRSQEQAILVGTNTVIEDNPGLTVRDWTGHNPTRLILDKDLKLDTTYNIFSDNNGETIIFCSTNALNSNDERLDETRLFAKKTDIIYMDINWSNTQHIASQICHSLFLKHINSVIIEGGLQTLQTFIDENLWDEARVFTGPSKFKSGVKAPKLKGCLTSTIKIMEDTLKIFHNE